MKGLCIIVLVILAHHSLAQEVVHDQPDLSAIVDDLYGMQDLDLNYEELYENLAQILSHPIDINKATVEELRFLKILSETQIQNLIQHRKVNGQFLSIYELQVVSGFDPAILEKIAPFVEVRQGNIDRTLINRIRKEGNNYLLTRYERTVETKEGFKAETEADNKFKGNPEKILLRFRSSIPNDYSIGFTAEKDGGEQFTWNNKTYQYGFDYLSVHAQLQNKGRIKNLIVGDFQAQFGQGLTIGGIFGMGKGGETITTTRRSNIGLLPYTSAFEGGYLRGGAATITMSKNIDVTGFYSRTKRDASFGTSEEDGEEVISSFQNTGLHRNTKELAKRKQTDEQSAGAVLQFKKDQIDGGLLFHHIEFDKPVSPAPRAYNQFAFRGTENNNVGAYINYTINNISFFSELSHSVDQGSAYVMGSLVSLSQNFDLSVLYRNYGRDYQGFYSNAFAEGSRTQNERGIYWGWKYKFNKKVNTVGYVDLFKFPWLKYRVYTPSQGYEALLRINYQPSKAITAFLQFREEVKTRNLSNDYANLYVTNSGRKRNYWISADYKLAPNLRMKTRAQFSTFNFNNQITKGNVLLQDISFSLGKFQATARYALFDTDDYDNRQYVYENDVWLAFSLPAYDGIGVRKYILLEYRINRNITIWIRYAHTRYTDREEIGSGVDMISGNTRNDVKFETRINF